MEKLPKFRVVEDIPSGDFVFEAFGESLNDLFANCALACFSAMTNPASVAREKEFRIKIDGDDINELLYNFIAELIYLKDVERVFLSFFDVNVDINKPELAAIVWGDHIDYAKHEIRPDVKAVTFHNLQVKSEQYGYSVRMILDL